MIRTFFSWLKRDRWIIGTLTIIGVVLFFIFFYSYQHGTKKNIDAEKDDSGIKMLQVPLANTLMLRKQFADALASWKDVLHPRPLYEQWIDKIGANGIVQTLETLNPECHDIAHDLGRLVYSRVGNIGDALRTCESACNSACMHGVLMEFFHKNVVITTSTVDHETEEGKGGESDHVTIDDIKTKLSTICGGKETTGNSVMATDYKQGDCAHGVGHALMFLSNYRIPKAIQYCRLFDSDALSYYCATGAYMEYITTHDTFDLTAHADDMFYPCATSEYPAACFRYKMPHVVPRFYGAGKTTNDLVSACLALNGKYQVGCFHGIGNGHFMFAATKRMTLARICNAGTHDDRYACIEGLMERLGRYEPENARQQCTTVNGWQQELCEADVRHELYDLSKNFDLYLQ